MYSLFKAVASGKAHDRSGKKSIACARGINKIGGKRGANSTFVFNAVVIDRTFNAHGYYHWGNAHLFCFLFKYNKHFGGLQIFKIHIKKPPGFNFVAYKTGRAAKIKRMSKNNAHIADDDIYAFAIFFRKCKHLCGYAFGSVHFKNYVFAVWNNFIAVFVNVFFKGDNIRHLRYWTCKVTVVVHNGKPHSYSVFFNRCYITRAYALGFKLCDNILPDAGFIGNAYELNRHSDVGKIFAYISAYSAMYNFYRTEVAPGWNIVPKRKSFNVDKCDAENSCWSQEKTLPAKKLILTIP